MLTGGPYSSVVNGYLPTMARARVLVLVVAVLIGITDAVALGVHDFDEGNSTAGRADTVAVDTTTAPPAGDEFRGPKGNYSLRVDPAWEHHGDTPIEGIETWLVAAVRDEFGPNMNVIVENVRQVISFEEYMQASVANLPRVFPTARVTATRFITGALGQRLGVIEYEADPQGVPLKFVGVFSVRNTHVAVATLTAPTDRFAEIRAAVEPYMLTLRAT
jgi:hypothetical protein